MCQDKFDNTLYSNNPIPCSTCSFTSICFYQRCHIRVWVPLWGKCRSVEQHHSLPFHWDLVEALSSESYAWLSTFLRQHRLHSIVIIIGSFVSMQSLDKFVGEGLAIEYETALHLLILRRGLLRLLPATKVGTWLDDVPILILLAIYIFFEVSRSTLTASIISIMMCR